METDTEAATQKPRPEPLDEIRSIVLGYTSRHTIEARWRSLWFSESGLSRLFATFGWLHGLPEPIGRGLAADLFEQFDRLNTYGGTETRHGYEIPRFRVSLTDDGTLHGFGLTWSRLQDEAYQPAEGYRSELTLERWDPTVKHERYHWYRYGWNGALLYHGPGRGEVFAVTLDSTRAWSVHT
jgi:hypothetical protein